MVFRNKILHKFSSITGFKQIFSVMVCLFGSIDAAPVIAQDLSDFSWELIASNPYIPGHWDTAYFTDYHAACQWGFDNFCNFYVLANYGGTLFGGQCLSGSLGWIHVPSSPPAPGGSYIVCYGTGKYLQGRQPQDAFQAFDVTAVPKLYKVIDFVDVTPPQQCAGDPIELGTGTLYEQENDLPAKGVGQVEFIRYYNNANSSAVWHYSYQQSLQSIDETNTDKIRYMSPATSGSKSDVCSYGAAHLTPQPTASWARNSSVSLNGDLCQFKQNGTVTRNLIVVEISRPNYVDAPVPAPVTVQLTRADGTIILYHQMNNNWLSINGSPGILEKVQIGNSAWRFTLNGIKEEYSADGKLLSITATNGIKQTLTYDPATNLLSQVQDTTGHHLRFAYTNSKLTSITTDDNKVTNYNYNAIGLFSDIQHPDNTHRLYSYEDIRFPAYLTGIIDERGVRYATWAYDAQGRAISSEHAGGADRTLIAFNADSSTTVTNSLNKKTIYRFADIAGARRVISVQGQPTQNCLGANKNYTYTPEGWLASKTDWSGNKTIYTYNINGLAISRTEASGTPVAKTITTEWHPTLNLKTKITEPDKETTFSYDANGLLLNQNARSLP